MRRGAALVVVAAIIIGFFAAAWPGAAWRGLIAEEIQPYLRRHPHVLERRGSGFALMPPYEPNAPAPPRWVATSEWPVLAYDGESRMWPVLIRGHQTALGSYAGILLGALFGGGPGGVRRTSVLLGVVLILLTAALARRLKGSAAVAAVVLAGSFGTVWLSHTGYAFELTSRVFMMAALFVAARPLTSRRALAVGGLTALALLSRATIGAALLPALGILLAARAPRRRELALVAAPLIFLPLVLLLPLRAGTAPLAAFPVEQLLARTAAIPSQLTLQLAWLGDANSVLHPLIAGDANLGPLWPFALVGALPLIGALARWWRGQAGDGERMFVCATLGSVLGGAWLYGSPRQFQLALALDPLVALAVADQLAAWRNRAPPAAAVAVALVVALRVQSLVHGLAAEARPGNPMLSGRVQHAAVDRLRALGVHGDDFVTTAYNHAGVLEAWSDGAITPLHAWPILAVSRDHRSAVLDGARHVIAARPRYVLVSDGSNLFDGPFTDIAAIAAALHAAAAEAHLALVLDARFPTERDTPGWSLWRLEPTR